MEQTVSSLTILATVSFIVIGLLRFLVWFARSSNADYQALSKVLDKERALRLEIAAERDEWKLKAMRYSDERARAIKYATFWRKRAKALEDAASLPPSTAARLTLEQDPNKSGVMRFTLKELGEDTEPLMTEAD